MNFSRPRRSVRAPKATKKGTQAKPEPESKLLGPLLALRTSLNPVRTLMQRNPPWSYRQMTISGQLYLGVSCIPRDSTHAELCQTRSSASTGPPSCLSK